MFVVNVVYCLEFQNGLILKCILLVIRMFLVLINARKLGHVTIAPAFISILVPSMVNTKSAVDHTCSLVLCVPLIGLRHDLW
jgi:hypothetical protein